MNKQPLGLSTFCYICIVLPTFLNWPWFEHPPRFACQQAGLSFVSLSCAVLARIRKPTMNLFVFVKRSAFAETDFLWCFAA